VSRLWGLCDLSYIGCEIDEGERQTLKENTPGWGVIYDLPFDLMEKLNMPIINLGPWGGEHIRGLKGLSAITPWASCLSCCDSF